MPAPALTISDSGFIDVTLGDVTQKLDAYRTYNQLLALDTAVRRDMPDVEASVQQVEYLDRVVALLGTLGYGAVSHKMADEFDGAFVEAVDALKKA